ncbi:hypothetical protein [Hymenobacter pini]|uniref:hypothetical protein n=1 Tax=Hymenobacter pini TaxID=2880879 RepID=UPI001CF359B0|nr:hypothetical protein [Hymenobacter pini]MCA8829026.1 hypothetical protein [Hymenobacter pini]
MTSNSGGTLLGSYLSCLGQFDLRLNSTSTPDIVGKGEAEFKTAGHTVLVRYMQFTHEWLFFHKVEAAAAWLFYTTKHDLIEERVTFNLQLEEKTDLTAEASTGEWLFAAEFESGVRQLHIGTEDEEAMAQRAVAKDWMPPRLLPLLTDHNTALSTLSPDNMGICTVVPQLNVGEQFYFHYVLAENPSRESIDYPGEIDIATWFAVNQSKHRLEKAWYEHKKSL